VNALGNGAGHVAFVVAVTPVSPAVIVARFSETAFHGALNCNVALVGFELVVTRYVDAVGEFATSAS
jgi:hypothetical protein